MSLEFWIILISKELYFLHACLIPPIIVNLSNYHFPTIVSHHPELERGLDIQPSHLSVHQTQPKENNDLDMDTDTVTTASASTTTLQDSSSMLQQDKIVSDIKPLSFLNKDLDFDDSNSSSKLLEGVVKQEPMSVDTVCSNKGKDLGYAHSDTASTPISTSNCTAPPLGPAPIRGSKPKRGVLR